MNTDDRVSRALKDDDHGFHPSGIYTAGSGLILHEQIPLSRTELSILRKAATSGNRDAQFRLGLLFVFGSSELDVHQDLSEAVRWLNLSALDGHPGALYQLGLLCAEGAGMAQDKSHALDLIMKSACAGYPFAQLYIGNYLLKVPGELKDAEMWLRRAADNEVPLAQELVAVKFSVDVNEKVYLLTAASNACLTSSQILLADIYRHGTGVPKNVHEALFWLEVAKLLGDELAPANLAVLEEKMKRNEVDAIEKVASNWIATHSSRRW